MRAVATPPLAAVAPATLTDEQKRWLQTGVDQPGGKLPLFDAKGSRVSADVIRSCVQAGLAEPWCVNPIQSETMICRLTEAGRKAIKQDAVIRVDFSSWRRDGGEA